MSNGCWNYQSETANVSTSSVKVYPVCGDYDYDKDESATAGFRAEQIILIEGTKPDAAREALEKILTGLGK